MLCTTFLNSILTSKRVVCVCVRVQHLDTAYHAFQRPIPPNYITISCVDGSRDSWSPRHPPAKTVRVSGGPAGSRDRHEWPTGPDCAIERGSIYRIYICMYVCVYIHTGKTQRATMRSGRHAPCIVDCLSAVWDLQNTAVRGIHAKSAVRLLDLEEATVFDIGVLMMFDYFHNVTSYIIKFHNI